MVEYSPAKLQVEIVTTLPAVLMVADPKEDVLIHGNISVSVAVLSAGLGSINPLDAIEAVFTRLPVALGEIFAVKVNVAVLPEGKSIITLILPVPLRGPAAPPV